jgi:hypothetical protein
MNPPAYEPPRHKIHVFTVGVEEEPKFMPMQSPEDAPQARIAAATWNIRVDAATAEVVTSLGARGIHCFVLKGPALSDWYGPDSTRTYADGDIWTAPAAHAAAQTVLLDLGFVTEQDETGLPDWWLEHASGWYRASDGSRIDLHRRLQGVGIEPARAWELLWPDRRQFEIVGQPAYRLPDPARVLYVTLHATHHGVKSPRSLAHVTAALGSVGDDVWNQALALARNLDAVAPFATGLRLLPAGALLAQRIGISDAGTTHARLLASTPPPIALGLDQLATAGTARRFAILARKLFPPPGFIRHWWKPAANSRRMLAVGYLYRPIWLLARAPAGYRAWRAARRDASSSS